MVEEERHLLERVLVAVGAAVGRQTWVALVVEAVVLLMSAAMAVVAAVQTMMEAVVEAVVEARTMMEVVVVGLEDHLLEEAALDEQNEVEAVVA